MNESSERACGEHRQRPALTWSCRGRTLELGSQTRVMGILNTTPDSFSDGGRYFDRDAAVERALAICNEGADIVDIGGESTRPGAEQVPEEEEIRRTLPVVREAVRLTDCLVSIDTMKSATARAALEAGAHIVNDVSAGRHDPDMPATVADYGAGVVLMHMLGMPGTMQNNPVYENVVAEVSEHLRERMDVFGRAGATPEQIAIDPGIGFGKTVQHNIELLRNIGRFAGIGRPVLIGASRKSFLGKMLGLETGGRAAASLSVAAYSILSGADIVRVHDVKETCQVARILDTLSAG